MYLYIYIYCFYRFRKWTLGTASWTQSEGTPGRWKVWTISRAWALKSLFATFCRVFYLHMCFMKKTLATHSKCCEWSLICFGFICSCPQTYLLNEYVEHVSIDGPEQALCIATLESKLKHTQAWKAGVDRMVPAWLCRQEPDREVEIPRLILRWWFVTIDDLLMNSIQSLFLQLSYLCVHVCSICYIFSLAF